MRLFALLLITAALAAGESPTETASAAAAAATDEAYFPWLIAGACGVALACIACLLCWYTGKWARLREEWNLRNSDNVTYTGQSGSARAQTLDSMFALNEERDRV